MVVPISKSFLLGDYRLEPDKRLLCLDGKPVRLTKRPFEVLLYLIENRERVVSRGELLDHFWDGKEVYDDTLRKCVGAIRKALNDHAETPHFIETHYSEGYRYIGAVEEEILQSDSLIAEVEKTRGFRVVIEEEYEVSPPDSPSPEARAMTPTEIANLEATNQRSALPQSHSLQSTLPRASVSPLKWVSRGRLQIALVVALVVAVITASALFFSRRHKVSAVSTASPIRSIAVMPLKNLSEDEAQEYFSDGVTESLINELSKIDGLKVISRSSVFMFKGKEIDPREIGRQLDVAAILEGNVRKSGNNVRVQIRLVNTDDGRIIWTTDTYNRAIGDIFTVQDEIGCSLSSQLKVRLCADPQRPPKRYTENVEAYQAYLQGRYFSDKRSADDLKKANEYFEQAIDKDPQYALAYAGLVDCYILSMWSGTLNQKEAIAKAKAAAAKALEIDDGLAEAHNALANVYGVELNWGNTGKEHERAIEINPGNAYIHHDYVMYLSFIGRADESIAEMRQARELDPLSLNTNFDLGLVYYYARRYNEAIAQLRKVLEMDRDFNAARAVLTWIYLLKGMPEEAIEEFTTPSVPDEQSFALAYVLATAGKRDEAQKELDKLMELSKQGKATSFEIAIAYMALHKKDKAFAWLDNTCLNFPAQLIDMKVDPRLDPLRSDLRFQNLLQRLGLFQ